MKKQKQIENKIREHELQIEYVKSLPLTSFSEIFIASDVARLEYGLKALKWVLSENELLNPNK